LALPGRALQLTYEGTVPLGDNWSTTITIPQFNNLSIGFLTGVRITLSGTAQAKVLAENLGTSPISATVNTSFRFDLDLKTPDASYWLCLASPSGSFQDVMALGAYDGRQDFQGTSTAAVTHPLQFSQECYYGAGSPTLNLFKGNGVVVLPCAVRGGFVSGSGGPGVVVGFNTQSDLTVTVVYDFVPFAYDPKLSLSQSADKSIIALGEKETFRFGLWNYTGSPVTDVRVSHNNGTPADASDDFLVGTMPTLAANSGASFVSSCSLPVRLETTLNGQPMDTGTLFAEFLPNRDLRIKLRQSRNVADNTYGKGAIGYPKGHKLGDFTASDKAQFRIRDGKGKIVLEFAVDYLSASSGFPSGYGSLGVRGGEGKMIIGSATAIKSATTTLSANLNQSPAFHVYTAGSPAEPNPKWEYAIGYDLVVDGTSFGPNGFGEVQVVRIHNSPSKIGFNDLSPVAVASCFLNSATATARLVDVIGSGEAAVSVCVQPPCTSGFSVISKDFTSTPIAAGRRLWFSSVVKLNGRSSTQAAKLRVDQSTIEFLLNGSPVSVDVPPATITFDPAATAASTTWDTASQSWVTRVPAKFTGNVFLTGVAYPVPASISAAVKDVKWAARFSQSAPAGIVPEWKWAAAVYTSFGSSPSAYRVKPIESNTLNPYLNSNKAGTPEAYKAYVISGALGGGGSNYTGNYTGALKVSTPCSLQ